MAVPVSIEITSTPVAPGTPSGLKIDVSEPVTSSGGETFTVMVQDPDDVLAAAVPVSITIGRGATSRTIPIATNEGSTGTATFSTTKPRLTATLDVSSLGG